MYRPSSEKIVIIVFEVGHWDALTKLAKWQLMFYNIQFRPYLIK